MIFGFGGFDAVALAHVHSKTTIPKKKLWIPLLKCKLSSIRKFVVWGQGFRNFDQSEKLKKAGTAGLPFPVPKIIEFVAFRDSGKISSNSPWDFPRVFLKNPRTDGSSHSLLEFSEPSGLQGKPTLNSEKTSWKGAKGTRIHTHTQRV